MLSTERWRVQLLCYLLAYFVQGLLVGVMGPSLPTLARLAESPVPAFGAVLPANAIGALLGTLFSDSIIDQCRRHGHFLLAAMSFEISVELVVLPLIVVRGVAAVVILFFLKGFCVAIINISINRLCEWIYSEGEDTGTIPYILNASFGLGTIVGPVVSLLFEGTAVDFASLFWSIALLNSGVTILALFSECPTPAFGTAESVTLLDDETNSARKSPALPSALVGGVFVQVHNLPSRMEASEDEYDQASTFIVLLGTMLTTCAAGLQVGLGTFLFFFLRNRNIALSSVASAAWTVSSYYLSLTIGFYIIRFITTKTQLPGISLLVESVILCGASVALVAEDDHELAWPLVCVFALALSAIFSNCLELMQCAIHLVIARRMAPLLMFGAACGETFIPMLMAFFMGDYSGAFYGATAVMYVSVIISFVMLGVAAGLFTMVFVKVRNTR